MPLDPRDLDNLRIFAAGGVSAIPGARATVGALLSELDRLRSELAAFTRPYLILDDPEGIIGCVDATSREAAWEAFKAANPNDYSGDPADNDVVIERVTVAWCDKLVDGLEIARSEIAAAQAGPVVEWRPTFFGAAAQIGLWRLSVGAERWALRLKIPDSLGLAELIDSGPETGPAGKSACEAAYRRACGFHTAPPCAG